jgi:hypothetical protein
MIKTEETIKSYIGNKYLIKLPIDNKCYSREDAIRLSNQCQKEAEMQALCDYVMGRIHTGIRTGSNRVELYAKECPYRCYPNYDAIVPFSDKSFEVIRLRELGFQVTVCDTGVRSRLVIEW